MSVDPRCELPPVTTPPPCSRWLSPLRLGAGGLTVLALAVAFVAPSAWSATATIDVAQNRQVIRGFGGATVFRPPLEPADLDLLFGSGPGQIGFTLLRIRVATDDLWRGYELSNALGARARGANVIATPWSPPAAMKDNNNLVAGALKPSSYAEYATYLNDFAKYMAASGAPLYAISVQNEPDIDVTYESCDWTPAQMADFCRNHANAITATKVIAPESFQFRKNISDPILNDPLAAENVDIIGGHIYGAGLVAYPLAASKGKEVWMTEYLDLETTWTASLNTGKEIHECLATANFNAYIWWYLKRYYGPLGEDGIVTKRGYVMSQFARFIRPGYVRVEATPNPATNVRVSAYKRDKLVIVAINQGTAAVSQPLTIQNATVASVTPWLTSSTVNAEAQPAIPVTAGAFTATLPAESITTFVGDLVFPAPVITAPPVSHGVAEKSTVVFDVTATAELPTYQWRRNGVAIAGATNRLLTITNVGSADAGQYTVTVSNSGGSTTSTAATLTVVNTPSPGRLSNLSVRSLVGTGNNVQIAGFVVDGASAKSLLIRAAGPTLAGSFGLPGTLTDPQIELRAAGGSAILSSNDNWSTAVTDTVTRLNAFPFLAASKDAALLASVTPGGYTAVVSGKDGGSGVALVEVYDADTTPASTLVNLSSRSFVGTQDQPIVGFVIEGATAKTVVIRATGPTLHDTFGFAGALPKPTIELFRAGATSSFKTAEGWEPALASHFAAVSAFGWPAESEDTAIVATLDPGGYTAVLRGKLNLTGTALLEIFAEP